MLGARQCTHTQKVSQFPWTLSPWSQKLPLGCPVLTCTPSAHPRRAASQVVEWGGVQSLLSEPEGATPESWGTVGDMAAVGPCRPDPHFPAAVPQDPTARRPPSACSPTCHTLSASSLRAASAPSQASAWPTVTPAGHPSTSRLAPFRLGDARLPPGLQAFFLPCPSLHTAAGAPRAPPSLWAGCQPRPPALPFTVSSVHGTGTPPCFSSCCPLVLTCPRPELSAQETPRSHPALHLLSSLCAAHPLLPSQALPSSCLAPPNSPAWALRPVGGHLIPLCPGPAHRGTSSLPPPPGTPPLRHLAGLLTCEPSVSLSCLDQGTAPRGHQGAHCPRVPRRGGPRGKDEKGRVGGVGGWQAREQPHGGGVGPQALAVRVGG